MIHCPICGGDAKAKTQERRKDKWNCWMTVDVYHHHIKQCREFEYEEEPVWPPVKP